MKKENVIGMVMSTLLLMMSMGACAESKPKDKALWDTDDQTIVKRSRNDICHDSSSSSFVKTEHFRAYRTMKDCLDSGGKRAQS